ncbi:MAG: hypothetical protein WAV15_01340 [Minisyncoccia bacterium]
MIYFILSLFFVSLLGIIFMIGRKVLMIQNGQIPEYPEGGTDGEYWEEFKYGAVKGLRKLGYAMLVGIIRLYVKLVNFLKTTYEQVVAKIHSMYVRKSEEGVVEAREVSKFLKMVGEYKRKLRRIKEKVKKEEDL